MTSDASCFLQSDRGRISLTTHLPLLSQGEKKFKSASIHQDYTEEHTTFVTKFQLRAQLQRAEFVMLPLITSSNANCCIEDYRFSEVRISKVNLNLTMNKSPSFYLSSYLFLSDMLKMLYKYLLEKKTNSQTKRMKSIITQKSSVFELTKQLCNETAKLFDKYTNRYHINN